MSAYIRNHRPGHKQFIAPLATFRRPSVNAKPQEGTDKEPTE